MEFRLEGNPAETIRQQAGPKLDAARADLVREAMIQALQRVIERNPVDTARSRAAWVNALEELGGIAPAGWEGPHPTAVEQGRSLSELNWNEETSRSRISVTNGVDYVSDLEYGTSRKSPFAMVRTALIQVARQTVDFFHW